jgi:hypothetical protein
MSAQELKDFKRRQIEDQVQKLKDQGKRIPPHLLEKEDEDGDLGDAGDDAVDVKGNKVLERKGKKEFKSILSDEMVQVMHIQYKYEKEQIELELKEKITGFDDEITEMQKEKYRLESDLKNAEMKLVLFYEELILLKSMEQRESELTEKLAGCRYAKGDIL